MSYNSLFGLGVNSADPNLTSWFRLQEISGIDFTGHVANITGTFYGDTSFTTGVGPKNYLPSCIDFDGVGEYIQIPASLCVYGSDQRTYGIWFSTDDSPVDGTRPMWDMGRNTSATAGRGIRANTEDGTVSVGYYGHRQIATKNNISLNEWNHSVTVVLSGAANTDDTEHYINGSGQSMTDESGSPQSMNTGDPLNSTLARGNSGSPVFFDGRLAEFFSFNRALNSQEVQEIYSGPEPINQIAPTISGNNTVGSTLICDPGTWGLDSLFSNLDNGTINYQYQWYSNGSAIAGATGSTYTIQGSDAGYEIKVLVSAYNDGGNDSTADTFSSPITGQSNTPSFNNLFGLGNNLADANLEGWWPLQETSGNSTDDYSDNNYNGSVGGPDISTRTGVGPNNWLETSIIFNNDTNEKISVGIIDITGWNSISWGGWVEKNTASNGIPFSLVHSASDDIRIYTSNTNTANIGIDDGTAYSVSIDPFNTSTWYSLFGSFGTGHLSAYENGSYIGGTSGSFSFSTANGTLYFGSRAASFPLDGRLANIFLFSKKISSEEALEIYSGPEPINYVAPTLSGNNTVGSTLTCNPGTWGLDIPFSGRTNGAITYQYQWYSNNEELTGETGSTYMIQESDVGSGINVLVSAYNDGGNDITANTFSLSSTGEANIITSPYASGGTITISGDYYIHTFTGTSGNFNTFENLQVEYLVLGGGGGGGHELGGGGGAGGLLHNIGSPSFLAANIYPVIVGDGGIGGVNRGNRGGNGGFSSFNNIEASGGGGGGAGQFIAGYANQPTGLDGGCGGGGSATVDLAGPGGSGVQGYNGGNGSYNGTNTSNNYGGGGGGMGSPGIDANGGPGAGGSGVLLNITGTPTYYAGGGGGSRRSVSTWVAEGGIGGGGDGGYSGFPPTNGTDYLGGGGGGGPNHAYPGADGGKGVVIIRYQAPESQSQQNFIYKLNTRVYQS